MAVPSYPPCSLTWESSRDFIPMWAVSTSPDPSWTPYEGFPVCACAN
jgi:hypothetical protein